MRYTQLENAGVEISELAVGTWALGGDSFGKTTDVAGCVDAIHTMLDHGVNLVDTAPCYGNGTSEKIVGSALAGIDRDSYYISTKVGLVTSDEGFSRDASFKNVMREVHSSLMNLGLDHIDFYFVHWPDMSTPFAETMSALELLRKQGKIRFIGVSNFDIPMIEECEKYATIDVIQPPFSMVDTRSVDLMKLCYERGIDSFTYGSLGAGILSGRFRTLPEFEPGDVRGTFYPYFREPAFSKVQELLAVMDTVAAAHGVPVSQVAVNWVAQKEYVATALVGVRTSKHAVENCAAFDWKLTPEEMALLDDTVATLQIG
jgi:aryl-alcohol dehydrogenase-like predicted oxidoreductase